MRQKEIIKNFPKAYETASKSGTLETFYRILRRLSHWGEQYRKCLQCAGKGGRILRKNGVDSPFRLPNTEIIAHMIELSSDPDYQARDVDLLGLSTCLNCKGEGVIYTTDDYKTEFFERDEKEVCFSIKKRTVPDNRVLVGSIFFHKDSQRWESHT